MVTRWSVWSALVAGAVSFSGLAAGPPADPKADAREKAARSLVERLGKGDFATAAKDFNEAMQKALPPDELKKSWDKVLGDAGDYKRMAASRQETGGGRPVVYVTAEFARAKWDARLAFDDGGKVAGLFFSPAKKPAPKGAEEIYEGTLDAGVAKVRLVVHLFKQEDGGYEGTLDSPDQGATGLALDEVRVKDDAVRLELKRSRIVFEGKRSRDGGEIAGDFKQAGRTFPLTLKRVTKASEYRRPQHPKPPFPYEAVEVAYENKKAGVKLAGTLTFPRSGGPFPAVLLITGSGAQDRDETVFGHKPFLVLADYLTRRGIAVLRVDDRGVGGSTGSVPQSTTADFAEDVLAGVEFLKGRKEVDAARIGLIGHSEGGIIAPLVASRSRDVAFIVLLAGTGLPGEEVLYLQGAALLKAAGADAGELARQRAVQERMFAVVRTEKDNAAAEKKIRAALDELSSQLGEDERKKFVEAMPMLEGQVRGVLTPWFRFFLEYDPRPALRKVTCPVLALNGEKDLQVVPGPSLKAIEAALKEGGNTDVTVKELPGLNHLFQTCRTGAVSEYASTEETMAPAALEAIASWIQERAGRRGGERPGAGTGRTPAGRRRAAVRG
jgi:fermentation-respiration switch protein FrsA (DUF1100 family)